MSVVAICGDSSSGKTVLANLLSYKLPNATVLECDRYHKWERHDVAWTKYTHLNPVANDIDLMNQDVLALKNGQSIFRRNYDHTVGKFTEEYEIKPSQNLIVCGLHTFMSSYGLYDLKIFMDADPVFKTEWKIARDMTKRGYTIEEVEAQIKARRADYELFIQPLIHDADIIVSFGSSLRLLIRDEYSIDNIARKLEVAFTLSHRHHDSRFQIDIETQTNYQHVILCVLDLLKQNE